MSFDLLTRLYHTKGRQGNAFLIDQPGSYQVSVLPWLTGAKVHLSYTDTQAIARWCIVGCCCQVFSLLLLG